MTLHDAGCETRKVLNLKERGQVRNDAAAEWTPIILSPHEFTDALLVRQL